MISDDDAREYIDTLLRHFSSRLSEWEDGFLRDLQRWAPSRFSDKQRAVIDNIMERCAAGHGR